MVAFVSVPLQKTSYLSHLGCGLRFSGQSVHANPETPPVVPESLKTIAVVDDFTPGQPQAHGRLVAGVIQARQPQWQIIPFHVQRTMGPNGPFYHIANALKSVQERLQGGLKLDALNLSMGDTLPLPEQPASAQAILNTLQQQPAQGPLSRFENTPTAIALEGVSTLSEIASRHKVPVFVAAGNEGPQKLNVYLLAQGVQGVGAKEAQGSPWPESGNNPWVHQWENAVQESRLETGERQSVGPGTSFATPAALCQFLRPKTKEQTS